MSITFEWKFSDIEVKPQLNEFIDVVVRYEWRRVAKDGEYEISSNGFVLLSNPNSENFIPFDMLNHDILVQWTLGYVNKTLESIDYNLNTIIQNSKARTLITKSPPWE